MQWWPLYKAGEPVDWMRRDLTRLQCQWEGYKTAVKPNVPSRRGTPAGFHSAFQLPKSGRLVSLRSTVAAAACGLKRSGFLGEMPMASARGRWRRSGRSLLKLMVALCFFASAISLCYLCFSSDCGGSGCVGFRRRTVLLRLDFGTRGTAYFGANQQDRSSSGRRWRRLLAEGPGSYPPRCTAKCGACVPCYPVHVAVPPGVPVTTEYYPEAWRCKCGNRLYMP